MAMHQKLLLLCLCPRHQHLHVQHGQRCLQICFYFWDCQGSVQNSFKAKGLLWVRCSDDLDLYRDLLPLCLGVTL